MEQEGGAVRTIYNLKPKRPSRSAGKFAQKIDLRKYSKDRYVKMDRLAKAISEARKWAELC